MRRTLAALPLVLTCALAAGAQGLPDFAQVRAAYRSSEALLLDRKGEVLSAQRMDSTVRRLDWVALTDISAALAAALVASEDRRFYRHDGVDWRGFVAALWDNLWRGLEGRRARGASTLTMQLAGLLDPALRPRSGERSLVQKWDQALAARELEGRWSKAEILEAYLNLVSFRGELQGIGAASQALFGKHAAGLNAAEAALLAALVRSPNGDAAQVARRACAVAAQAASGVGCEAVTALALAHLSGRYRLEAEPRDAPHLARRLLRAAGERRVSTLDAGLQRYAAAVLAEHLSQLADQGAEDGAVIVIDNSSGEVLAYVGSSGQLSAAAAVDAVLAPRQAGSTLKPFLYGLAIERRLLTAASLLDDSPLQLATGSGLYVPQNYERDFKGRVSLRPALASSLNVPAVRTLALVGVDVFHDRLRKLGLDTLTEPGEHYGFSLALGSAEVRLADLSNAYRALARGGEWSPLVFEPGATGTPARRVMSREAAFIVADILADNAARALTFGLGNPLATPGWSAVKTGTSKDMRDNWCLGFSDRYTVGVWVGQAAGQPMRALTGVSGAAPVWHALMSRLMAASPSSAPHPPAGVLRAQASFDPPLESARQEWFLRGTEPLANSSLAAAPSLRPRIRYPSDGAVLALDPDIPEGRQRVMLESSPAGAAGWRIDDQLLAAKDGRAAWAPGVGRHRLVLLDAAGEEIDAVVVDVRGPQSRRISNVANSDSTTVVVKGKE